MLPLHMNALKISDKMCRGKRNKNGPDVRQELAMIFCSGVLTCHSSNLGNVASTLVSRYGFGMHVLSVLIILIRCMPVSLTNFRRTF